MATCNSSGLLKLCTSASYNCSLNPVCTASAHVGVKGGDIVTTMPPRTTNSVLVTIADLKAYGDADIFKPPHNSMDHSSASPEQSHSLLYAGNSLASHDELTPLIGAPTMEFESATQKPDALDELLHRKLSCRKRLEACSKRLRKIRLHSLALLSHTILSSAARSSTVSSNNIARFMDDDETESSTDDESPLDSKESSRLENHWLCTRSVLHSHWLWLLMEMKKSGQTLHNLNMVKASYKQWRAEELSLIPDGSTNNCSRTTPLTRVALKRHTVLDLGSSKCAGLIEKLGKFSFDPTIPDGLRPGSLQCSCLPGLSGPCIACCGSTSDNALPPQSDNLDLMETAAPLIGHVHPKLSFPGDIQLSVRLESRLAAATHLSFRSHRTTTRRLSGTDKPSALPILLSPKPDPAPSRVSHLSMARADPLSNVSLKSKRPRNSPVFFGDHRQPGIRAGPNHADASHTLRRMLDPLVTDGELQKSSLPINEPS